MFGAGAFFVPDNHKERGPMEAISILIYNRNQSQRSAALARSLTRIKLSEGENPRPPRPR